MIKFSQWQLFNSNANSKAAWKLAEAAYKTAATRFSTEGMRWSEARKSLNKTANYGQNQNPEFEKAFGSIAFTYLSEKAPGLLPHIQGFQLLDRADDGNKAIGAFVAQVGDKVIDIPMFFVNGELKGHQIMRLRNPELIVPLRESWLNYVLGQMPQDLGEAGPNENEPSSAQSSPSIQPFSGSRYLKAGSENMLHKWAQSNADEAYVSMRYNPTNLELGISLLDKQAGSHVDLGSILSGNLPLLKVAADLCDGYPSFRSMLDRHLGSDWMVKAASAIRKESPAQLKINEKVAEAGEAVKPSDLRFISVQDSHLKVAGLSVERVDEIAKWGCYIEDNRGADKLAISVPADLDSAPEVEVENHHWAIEAPDESGVFEVVETDGSTSECAIFPSMRLINGGMTHDLIIRKSDKAYRLADRNSYIAKRPLDRVANPSEFGDGAIGASDSRPEEGDIIIVMADKATVAGPFRVQEKLGPDRYIVSLHSGKVQESSQRSGDNEPWWNDVWSFGVNPGQEGKDIRRDCDYRSCELHFVKSDNKSQFLGQGSGCLIAPHEAKIVKLKGDSYGDKGLQPMCRDIVSAGNLSKLANLTVEPRLGDEVVINDVRLRKSAGRNHLVNLGVEKTAAESMIEGPKVRTRYFLSRPGQPFSSIPEMLKTANFYVPATPTPQPNEDLMPSESGAYSISTPESETESAPREASKEVLPEYAGVPSNVNDAGLPVGPEGEVGEEMQSVIEQDGAGVMDDMVGLVSLLRNSRIDSSLKQTTKALLAAIDKLGRQIFIFHAHPDEFADVFGDDELNDLESAMVSTFENAGDLFITLSRTGPSDAAELDMTALPGAE